ncbi:MAG TPA: PPOX class F420-dependent oxidoreductase [Nitrosopumilaceae archaeon]|nr:PPOX class F420-dependent oxidoreductase [Nitrosopumilaceae archaeon]
MQISREIDESVLSLLTGKNFAFVATLMKDGSPQITPTWIDFDGKAILINTAEGRVKQKNLSRDPRIAISIVDHNNPYNMVTIRGKVMEQTSEGADEHIDKLTKRYLGFDNYPYRSPTEKRIIIKILPENVFHMKP